MKKKSMFLRQRASYPNLFIGAVGGTYSTATLLADALLGISDTDITLFSIDGSNNISCRVELDFSINSTPSGFNSLGCTWFIDVDGHCTTIGTYALAQNIGMKRIKIDNMTTLSGAYGMRKIYVDHLSLPSYSSGSASDPLTQSTCKTVRLDGLIHSANLGQFSSIQRFYIPSFAPPNPAVDSGFFSNFLGLAGWKLYIPNGLLTANGGGLDATCQYAVTTYSATVVGIANTTPPSSVTDLSPSNITSTTVDLSFTPPSSTNALEFYEVWIDDGGDALKWGQDGEILASGDTYTGLISGTTYDIWIVACDEYCNRSIISNVIQITTS